MADSELHMLEYWIDDKGIETAFAEYYPELASRNLELRHLLSLRAAATARILKIAERIVAANMPVAPDKD